MEFDWIAPSGRALLTSFMADHYSAGWWMDAAPTLEAAEAEVHRLFTELATMAATKNVMLPVGTDYTPPNKWVSAIQRDWNSRYVWPKFTMAIPREYFDAVRAAQAATGPPVLPADARHEPDLHRQGRLVHRHQADAAGRREHAPGRREVRHDRGPDAAPGSRPSRSTRPGDSSCSGPTTTGSPAPNRTRSTSTSSVAGARRSSSARPSSTAPSSTSAAQIETAGDGQAVTVFNALSWSRTDIARVEVDLPDDRSRGLDLVDDAGERVPFVVESADPREAGGPARATIAFLARDVPAVGYRTFHAVPGVGARSTTPAGGRSTRWPSRTRPSR